MILASWLLVAIMGTVVAMVIMGLGQHAIQLPVNVIVTPDTVWCLVILDLRPANQTSVNSNVNAYWHVIRSLEVLTKANV